MNRLLHPFDGVQDCRGEAIDFPASSSASGSRRYPALDRVLHTCQAVERALAWPFHAIAFALAQQRRREDLRNDLMRMGRHELNDIGVARCQIDDIAKRTFPLWPTPPW